MNWYEHHLGDYAEATGHLSWLEDMAYTRMIRKYYASERPLPPEVAKVQRLVGARSKAEKQAVASVLEEFFFLEADGWHNARCDEELARYHAGEPGREERRTNKEERERRHREERARLFEQLRGRGIHLPWNVGIEVLRSEVAKHCTPDGVAASDHAVGAATPATDAETQPATAPATPATATHSPFPTTHSPEGNTSAAAAHSPGESLSEEPLGSVAAVGKALVKGGLQAARFSQSNPHVIALKDLGASELEVVTVTQEALKDQPAKGLGWIVGAIKGRRQDAADVLAKPPPPTRQQRTSNAADHRSRQGLVGALLTGAMRTPQQPQQPVTEVFDVESRLIAP